MSGVKQSKITFFSTTAELRSLSKSDWYSQDKVQLTTDKDFELISKFSFYKDHPVFVATSTKCFLKFLNFFFEKVMGSELFCRFHKTSPVFIDLTSEITPRYLDVLRDIFPTIISTNRDHLMTLKQDEMMTVLNKPMSTRSIRALGIQVFKDLGILKIVRGNFSTLIVKMDSLSVNGQGLLPDFDDIEIIDFGNAIRFGAYESSMRGLLYENDRQYRLERKKQRFGNERSFGACLRRFRLQKKLNQTDFYNVSEKTIRRIEGGEIPKTVTKNKILAELGLAEDDLLTY